MATALTVNQSSADFGAIIEVSKLCVIPPINKEMNRAWTQLKRLIALPHIRSFQQVPKTHSAQKAQATRCRIVRTNQPLMGANLLALIPAILIDNAARGQ